MRPPCFCTMPYDSDSPSPVPWPTGLVVKKGSKNEVERVTDYHRESTA